METNSLEEYFPIVVGIETCNKDYESHTFENGTRIFWNINMVEKRKDEISSKLNTVNIKTPNLSKNPKFKSPFKSPFKIPLKNDCSVESPISKKQRLQSSPKLIESMNENELKKEEDRLISLINQKEKELENLKKKSKDPKEISKSGNADGKLESLVTKWINLCQTVLIELQQKSKSPTSLKQLMYYFQIEPNLIQYNSEIDGF